jgi:hypothetical protein
MTIEKLASQFIDHGRYIRNWSPKTVRTYQQNLATFRQAVGETAPTKASLNAFVMWMRERGLTRWLQCADSGGQFVPDVVAR